MTVQNKFAQADQAVQNAQLKLQEAVIKQVQTNTEELAKKTNELAKQADKFRLPKSVEAEKAREFSKTSSPTDAKKEESTASSGIITTVTGYVASTLGGIWGWLGSSATGNKS